MNWKNSTYRDFLIKNTNNIIKINHSNNLNQINNDQRKNTSPYIFDGPNDNSKPYGYEESMPKNMYLSQQQLNNRMLRPLQYGY
uniref:Uncharacterized protein n=1 Tax=viral metagenome TaxID=1070528 RepID=A0A6C0ETN5_9ZZZZ